MRSLLAIAAALLAARAALAGEEGCGVCHGAERVQHERSIHRSGDLGCVSCHGGDPAKVESREAAHAKDKGYRGRIGGARAAEVCGSCHSDVALMRPYSLRTDVLAAYRSSHHGKAVLEKGDEGAAICLDCHGTHEVLRVRDPRSPASRGRVRATCGKCHADQALMGKHGLGTDAPKDFAASVSDAARKREHLSMKRWARRFNLYLNTLEKLLSPDLIILGGGISKEFEAFLPEIHIQAEIVPAQTLNEAGIIGAALAARSSGN